jgi:UDP-hydrolysing UDP-N-acetyl-D-glucosamine 2-epimerase
VTGSRAEYSHLRWLAREIADDARLELQVLVTGAHLSPQFGETWREIEADGFTIQEKVPVLDGSDRAVDIAAAMGRGVTGMAAALDRLKPDLLIILGDRFEMLAAASAALVMTVPVAHLHGGETTEGAFDESIRHAITKMAHLHFTAAAPYRDRVLQLGEDPARVFQVGAPGLDLLTRETLPDRAELEAVLGISLEGLVFLVTYHPVTLSGADPALAVGELLAALDRWPQAKIVVTGVNADTGNSAVSAAFTVWQARHPDRVRVVASLGHRRYMAAMTLAAAVIGNSSSGVIEAPAVGVPTVNLGDRQKGRLRAESVVDCGETEDEIAAAIATVLDPAFRQRARTQTPPLGRGGASAKIKDILATADLTGILMKHFHDLKVPA